MTYEDIPNGDYDAQNPYSGIMYTYRVSRHSSGFVTVDQRRDRDGQWFHVTGSKRHAILNAIRKELNQ